MENLTLIKGLVYKETKQEINKRCIGCAFYGYPLDFCHDTEELNCLVNDIIYKKSDKNNSIHRFKSVL